MKVRVMLELSWQEFEAVDAALVVAAERYFDRGFHKAVVACQQVEGALRRQVAKKLRKRGVGIEDWKQAAEAQVVDVEVAAP